MRVSSVTEYRSVSFILMSFEAVFGQLTPLWDCSMSCVGTRSKEGCVRGEQCSGDL